MLSHISLLQMSQQTNPIGEACEAIFRQSVSKERVVNVRARLPIGMVCNADKQ
jgi:hypothetical protein